MDFVPTTAAALGSTATHKDGLKSKKFTICLKGIFKIFIDIVGPKALPIKNNFPPKNLSTMTRFGRPLSLEKVSKIVLIF